MDDYVYCMSFVGVIFFAWKCKCDPTFIKTTTKLRSHDPISCIPESVQNSEMSLHTHWCLLVVSLRAVKGWSNWLDRSLCRPRLSKYLSYCSQWVCFIEFSPLNSVYVDSISDCIFVNPCSLLLKVSNLLSDCWPLLLHILSLAIYSYCEFVRYIFVIQTYNKSSDASTLINSFLSTCFLAGHAVNQMEIQPVAGCT